MILAIDVQYEEDSALAAGVLFSSWGSPEPDKSVVKTIEGIEPYEAGSFYKRELPCILSLLEDIEETIEVIIVDGFVTLGKEESKGLGMHLYDSLENKIPIIGVAKRSFKGTPEQCELYSGDSAKPLFITAVGVSLEDAKSLIASMDGKHRIPTLLKRVDQLCRGIEP